MRVVFARKLAPSNVCSPYETLFCLLVTLLEHAQQGTSDHDAHHRRGAGHFERSGEFFLRLLVAVLGAIYLGLACYSALAFSGGEMLDSQRIDVFGGLSQRILAESAVRCVEIKALVVLL